MDGLEARRSRDRPVPWPVVMESDRGRNERHRRLRSPSALHNYGPSIRTVMEDLSLLFRCYSMAQTGGLQTLVWERPNPRFLVLCRYRSGWAQLFGPVVTS